MDMARKVWHWLNDDPRQLIGIRILQICVGSALLFQICTELPFAPYLWGPGGIGWGFPSPVLGPTLTALLDTIFATDAGVFTILFLLGLSALGLVFGYSTRTAALLAAITFSLLLLRLPELGDGGDNMSKITLIYMCFLLPDHHRVRSGSFQVWLHNMAVLAISFQLIIMYITSGFAKAMGTTWQQGIAMYYISQVQWFTLPGAHSLFINPWIVTLATYIPMFYQLLFPIAIISRIKLPWILLGILFHLGIALLMGLVTFSVVMIGLELFFITDQEYAVIWQRVSQMWQTLSANHPVPFTRWTRHILPKENKAQGD